MKSRLRNKWIKRFFPLIVLLLLIPWPVAYANTYTGHEAGPHGVRVHAAEASTAPSMTVFRDTIGGVAAGTLFNIDAIESPADLSATVHITNSQDLVHHYKYLILNLGIYVEGIDGNWEQVSTDIFITMRNGQVSFTLPGLARYRVTVESGSYCTTSAGAGDGTSPVFYLEVN